MAAAKKAVKKVAAKKKDDGVYWVVSVRNKLFGWKPTQHTHVAEVGVFRDDDVIVGLGIRPDRQIGGSIQADQKDMGGIWKEIDKPVY